MLKIILNVAPIFDLDLVLGMLVNHYVESCINVEFFFSLYNTEVSTVRKYEGVFSPKIWRWLQTEITKVSSVQKYEDVFSLKIWRCLQSKIWMCFSPKIRRWPQFENMKVSSVQKYSGVLSLKIWRFSEFIPSRSQTTHMKTLFKI